MFIKIFAISLPSSHFLTATLDFTSFFTIAFLGAAHFFYSWAVLEYLDFKVLFNESEALTK